MTASPDERPATPDMAGRSKLPFHLCVLATLYTAQFLPGSFFGIALVAILRREGVQLEHLALLYVFGLVTMLGVVWSPFVDRLRFAWLGHYRGWLLITQFATVMILFAIAWLDIPQDLAAMIGLGLALSFVGSFGSIATDAFACRVLPPERRGLGNGIQVAGGSLGYLLGGGALLAIYPVLGWAQSVAILVLVSAIPLGMLLFVREPRVNAEPGSRPGLGHHYRRFLGIWRVPGGWRWFAVILSYPIGVAVSQSVFKPMLVDAGWSLPAIGTLVNSLGAIAAMIGAVSGGWLVRHVGRRRLLRVIPLAQAASIVPLLAVAAGHTGEALVAFVSIVTMVAFSPGTAMVMTVAMDRASTAHTGTDYAVQSSAYFVTLLVAGMVGLQIAGAFGYVATVAVGAVACLVSAVVAFRLTAPGSSLVMID